MELYNRFISYKDRQGIDGKNMGTFYRFKGEPNSEFPHVYKDYDSLSHHTMRLLIATQMLLPHYLTPDQIRQTQYILITHDVPELDEGDVSRLATQVNGSGLQKTPDHILERLLHADDIVRYRDFETAEHFLEKGSDELPQSPLSIIARMLDTLDGNCYAFAIQETHFSKLEKDIHPRVQAVFERGFNYVNRTREKYRTKIAYTDGYYELNLRPILQHIHEVEKKKIEEISTRIRQYGYTHPEIV